MDDLISRQAAIRAVNTALFPKINTAKDAEKALRDLPSAQPRPRGQWIDAIVADTLPVIVCDQCNTFFPLAFGASHNFCPNCGADMREEEQDELHSSKG